MRALLLLVLLVVAFLTVRWFTPARAGAPEEPASPEATSLQETNGATEAGVRFLAPQPAAEEAAPREAAVPSGAALEANPAESWPANLLPAGPSPEDELRIAEALVHGTPADVQEASLQLPRDRALLLESFSWAVSGERQLALSLSEKIASKEGAIERERALFEAAVTGQPPPESPRTGPVTTAMEMALLARQAKQALSERRCVDAAKGFSALLVDELAAPWTPDVSILAEWTEGLDAAQREHRWNPRSSWPGVDIEVASGDSLIAVRLRYLKEREGALMCTGLIERANRLKGYLQPGQVLRVPTDPVRVQVDLGARWALYFLGDEVAAAWPVGIGRPGEDTPPGEYEVRNKLENPPWMKEGQEPIPFGDSRNPLGTRWIGWSRGGVKTSFGFHGTWEPESIGQAASDGCVRLLNQHVEQLFQILPEGAPVRIDS